MFYVSFDLYSVSTLVILDNFSRPEVGHKLWDLAVMDLMEGHFI